MTDLEAYATTVAYMVADGELVDGDPYEMVSEDAIMTLNALIYEARRILGC